MKLNKTLITAALTCCMTSGPTMAEEVKFLEFKNINQIININSIQTHKNGTSEEETQPEPDCPKFPYCKY